LFLCSKLFLLLRKYTKILLQAELLFIVQRRGAGASPQTTHTHTYTGGAYRASTDPLPLFKGPTSKEKRSERGGKNEGEGEEREGGREEKNGGMAPIEMIAPKSKS